MTEDGRMPPTSPAESRAPDELLALLQPSDSPRWAEAVRRLDADRSLPVLAEILGDPSRESGVRQRAASIVGLIRDRRGIAILEAAAGARDELVRGRVIGALGAIGEPQAAVIRIVTEATGDPSAFVRRAAARALAALQLPEAPKILARMAASDPVPKVRRAAEEAARAVGGGSG